jgi:paraquat-inducible protein A
MADQVPEHHMLLCGGCDLLMETVDPPPGHTLFCPRCGKRLHRWKSNSIEKTLAISLTGLLLYLPANFMPLLTFDVLGLHTSASLFDSTLSMFDQGQFFVGIMVVLCGFVFPLFLLSLFFSVSFGLYRGWRYRWMAEGLRFIHHLHEWAMPDVYLIGVFVTIVKMSHMAEINFNIGLFCFIGLVLMTIGCQGAMDRRLFWHLLDADAGKRVPVRDTNARTGAEAGLCLCHACEKILPVTDCPDHCPRCGEHLHLRKTNAMARTWALVLTAIILTLPANLLPIMEVEYFGVPDRSTIMDGILYFFREGSYGIGLIILTASVLVPLFKILGLILILISIHLRWPGYRRHKAIMLRFIEFIGRWSMLDIFVIALLCALVQFGFISTISAAPAVFYFTGVVICTMFAALSFDARLLWDAHTTSTGNRNRHAATGT